MGRIISTMLATLAGTVFAVFGVQAKSIETTVTTTTVVDVQPYLIEPSTTLATTTTTTVALPASVPLDKSMRCPKYEALFAKYELPVEIFSYIAWRESNCRPRAINATWDAQGNMTYHLNSNKSWDSGLLQINSSWVRSVRKVCNVAESDTRKDLEVLFNPDCNVKFAKWIMDNTTGGLSNWSM